MGVLALLVAVVAGGGWLVLTMTSPSGEPRGLQPDAPVMGLLIGWSFTGAGVVAAVRRSRFGLLLYGTGLAWFLSALMATGDPVWFTVGLLTAPWWLGLFLHALLVPHRAAGRPVGSPLVAVLYVDVTLLQALRLSTSTPPQTCPAAVTASQRAPGQRSAGRRGHDPPRAAGRDRVARVIGGTLVVLALRWRWATAPSAACWHRSW